MLQSEHFLVKIEVMPLPIDLLLRPISNVSMISDLSVDSAFSLPSSCCVEHLVEENSALVPALRTGNVIDSFICLSSIEEGSPLFDPCDLSINRPISCDYIPKRGLPFIQDQIGYGRPHHRERRKDP